MTTYDSRIAFGFGGVGGTGVLGLGPEQNTFGISTTANRAAAETLRDSYATANTGWLAEYDDNLSFWIRLVWNGGAAEQRRNAAGTGWEDVTNVIRGVTGDGGPQGRFPVQEYVNSTATPTLAGGGSYNLNTNVFTPTTGATEDRTVPGTGEDIYVREAFVNDAVDSGLIDLSSRWSAWVEFTHLTSGLSHVEHTDDFTGTGTVADPLGAEVTLARILDLGDSPTQTGAMFAYSAPAMGYTAGGFLSTGQFVQFEIGTVDSPDDSDVIIQVGTDDYTLTALGGLAVKLFEIVDDTKYLAFGKGDVLLLLGPTDGSGRVVDITESSLPPADADAIGKIYVNRRIPAAYMIHEVPHANTPVAGSFNDYVSARDTHDNFNLFQGAMGADFFTLRVGISDQTLDSRHVGLFYWNWRDHTFREWVETFNQQTSTFNYHWQSAHNPGVLLGGTTGVYLGYDTLDSDLLRQMPQDQIDASRRYIGVATHGSGSDEFREFDNSTYVAAVAPFNVYDFVTVGLYGAGGNAGQTLGQVNAAIQAALNILTSTIDGAGLTNSGTALEPILNVDPTQTDFPTIPVDKGGTGATDASAARTALGLAAADILALLLGVDGAGSGLDADLLDGMTPAEVAALGGGGGGGGFTLRFGVGSPGNVLGDNGDWYINTSVGAFSEKVAGAWIVRYTDMLGQAGTGLTETQVDARIDALALRRLQNLADLANIATARTNLGLGTAAILDSGTGAGNLQLLDADGRILVANLPINAQNAVRNLSYNTGQPQRLGYTEVDGTQSFINLSRLAALTGAIFTGDVKGIAPTDDADLTRKDYVDDADVLRALLTGAIFTGAVQGITPTADAHLSRKDYVDNADNLRALLAGAIFTGAVQGITPTADAHLSRKDYVDNADALRAQLTGAIFTGAVKGIAPADSNDFVTLSYFNTHSGGGQVPPDDHVLRVGWSDDTTFVDSELTADSTTYTVTIPPRATIGYIGFWIKDQNGAIHSPSDVHYGGHSQSQIGSYEDPIAYTYSGEAGHLWRTISRQDFNLAGDSLEVIF